MVLLYSIRLQLRARKPHCGLNDVSGHIGESHMSGNCRQPLEPKVVIQPQGKEFSHQSK